MLAFSTVAETIVAVQTAKGIDFRVRTERRGQAEYLVPVIQELLADNGITLNDLGQIGVVTGPGSFTGLRVGLAAAEGFGIAMDTPLVGIDSFMWWRWAARQAGLTKPAAVILDTLRDDVFIAVYDGPRTLLDPQVMSLADARQLIEENPVILVGDAGHLLPEYNFAPLSHQSLAESLLQLTGTLQGTTTAPVYLRAPEITAPAAAK